MQPRFLIKILPRGPDVIRHGFGGDIGLPKRVILGIPDNVLIKE